MFIVQRGISSPAFVKDLQCGAIFNGIHQLVFIDIFAKAFDGTFLTVAFCNQWRSGEGNAGRIGEGLKNITAQI